MLSFFDSERRVSFDFRLCGVPDDVAALARSMVVPVTDPDSAEGTVLLQGQPLCIGDIQTHWDRLHPLYQQLAHMTKARSLIAVPLKITDRILGAITVDRTNEQALTQDDLDVMTTLATQVAIALDNARAYREIEQLNIGLEERVRDRTAALEQANTNLETANLQLQEMNRLKSAFVSVASHELRTPMTSIKGYVRNMLDGVTGGLAENQRHYLSRIQHNSERLTRMIDQLLDLSRIEAGQILVESQPIYVPEVLTEVVESLQSLAQEKRINLLTAIDEPMPVITADRDKIQQVLINLGHNAIKFTPDGGTVRIAASPKASKSK